MLDMILGELESFYPGDEIIKDYGEALMKYKSEGFIYPYTTDEEKEMIHNTEKQLAYDEGVVQGIEQKNMENARKMKEKGYSIKDIQDITGLSEEEISKL